MLLADHASVRDGLLTVVSAGVTRVRVPAFPAHPPLSVALQFYIPPSAFDVMHTGKLTIKYADGGQPIATAEMALQAMQAPQMKAGEPMYVPAAIPLVFVEFDRPGAIDINVAINKSLVGSLTFWIDGPD
jgi:hypothetical protein